MGPGQSSYCMALHKQQGQMHSRCPDIISLHMTDLGFGKCGILQQLQLAPGFTIASAPWRAPPSGEGKIWTCMSWLHYTFRINVHWFTARANRQQSNLKGSTDTSTNWQSSTVGVCLLALPSPLLIHSFCLEVAVSPNILVVDGILMQTQYNMHMLPVMNIVHVAKLTCVFLCTWRHFCSL